MLNVLLICVDKIHIIKPREFKNDYKLFTYARGTTASYKLVQMPSYLETLGTERTWDYTFENTSSNSKHPWLKEDEVPSEVRVHRITTELLKIYTQKRTKIFQDLTRTKTTLFSNEYVHLYQSPSNTIGTLHTLKFHCRSGISIYSIIY